MIGQNLNKLYYVLKGQETRERLRNLIPLLHTFAGLMINIRLWFATKRRVLKCLALKDFLQHVHFECVIMPLFNEVTDKPWLKPLDNHFTFDLSGYTLVFTPPQWANARLQGVNRRTSFKERWLERAAGTRLSTHLKKQTCPLYLRHKLLYVPFWYSSLRI